MGEENPYRQIEPPRGKTQPPHHHPEGLHPHHRSARSLFLLLLTVNLLSSSFRPQIRKNLEALNFFCHQLCLAFFPFSSFDFSILVLRFVISDLKHWVFPSFFCFPFSSFRLDPKKQWGLSFLSFETTSFSLHSHKYNEFIQWFPSILMATPDRSLHHLGRNIQHSAVHQWKFLTKYEQKYQKQSHTSISMNTESNVALGADDTNNNGSK